jgi:c-di-GMP-binding flagellar brake protein YcgR
MEQVSRSSNERRTFTRMKTDTATELIIRGEGNCIKGICRDLSGGGMLIETRVALRTGTELEVRLASHYNDKLMLKARTQVARVKRKPSGNFILGMEILEILD